MISRKLLISLRNFHFLSKSIIESFKLKRRRSQTGQSNELGKENNCNLVPCTLKSHQRNSFPSCFHLLCYHKQPFLSPCHKGKILVSPRPVECTFILLGNVPYDQQTLDPKSGPVNNYRN